VHQFIEGRHLSTIEKSEGIRQLAPQELALLTDRCYRYGTLLAGLPQQHQLPFGYLHRQNLHMSFGLG